MLGACCGGPPLLLWRWKRERREVEPVLLLLLLLLLLVQDRAKVRSCCRPSWHAGVLSRRSIGAGGYSASVPGEQVVWRLRRSEQRELEI